MMLFRSLRPEYAREQRICIQPRPSRASRKRRLKRGRGSLLRSLSKESECNSLCHYTRSLNYLTKKRQKKNRQTNYLMSAFAFEWEVDAMAVVDAVDVNSMLNFWRCRWAPKENDINDFENMCWSRSVVIRYDDVVIKNIKHKEH